MKYLMIALLFMGVAHASPPDNRPPDNRPPDRPVNVRSNNVNHNNAVGVGIANATSTSNSRSSVRNHNVNKQGQLQGQSQSANNTQGQSAEQSQSANNDGNHQNISFEDKRQAPGIGGPASGPCTGVSGGLSVIGGAITFASVDAECDKREAARIAHILGEGEIAKKVLMSLDAVKAVLEEDGMSSGDIGGGSSNEATVYDDPFIEEFMK